MHVTRTTIRLQTIDKIIHDFVTQRTNDRGY